jgi:hypothetical protein
MWRFPFLNLTFVILVLTIMTMQRWALRRQPSEDDFTEFSQSNSQVQSADSAYPRRLSQSLMGVARHFAQIWQRTEMLAQWRIESESAQWEKARASTIVEKELIEARSHVETAEVYEWVIKNRQKTTVELSRAEGFLEKTRPLIKEPALATVERVTKELDLMKTDVTGEEANRLADYEIIKTDLDRVIDWVRTVGL